MNRLTFFLAWNLQALLALAGPAFPAFTFNEILAPNSTNATNSAIPPECQQICAPIVPLTFGNQSCTPSLCCTSEWEHTYYSCILCAAQAQQISDLSIAQHTLDVIFADCSAAGKPIQLLTFPGQSPNRTLPAASVSSSGSATGSATNGTASSTSLSTSSSSTPSHSSTSTSNNSGFVVQGQLSTLVALFVVSAAFGSFI